MATKFKPNMVVTVSIPGDERSYFGEVVEVDGSTIYVWLRVIKAIKAFPRRQVRQVIGAPSAQPLVRAKRKSRR